MTTATESREWVVVGTWTEDGEVTCQILAEGFETEAQAQDAAADALTNLGASWEAEGGEVEVATREEAELAVTE